MVAVASFKNPFRCKHRPSQISADAYSKNPTTFRAQAQLLLDRGMVGDIDAIERRLTCTNYYRLAGYFYFFRMHQGATRKNGEQFRPGTTFDAIWNLYTFDSRLRSLTTVAIEKIEIAIRTQVSYHHAMKFGPFAYALDPSSIKLGMVSRDGMQVDRRDEFMGEVQKSLNRSEEQFIEHFYQNYSDEYPPIFITSEVLTLGCLQRIYDGSSEGVQRPIANYFKLPPTVLSSWLLTFNTARNVCAHHGRFWNRSLGNRPRIPPADRYALFHKPFPIIAQPFKDANGKVVNPPTTFAILSMCNYLLTEIDPGCGWAKQVKQLLDENPEAKKAAMGFPANWTQSPIWHDVD
jgi:abortive infection bacteriophage resistance protein